MAAVPRPPSSAEPTYASEAQPTYAMTREPTVSAAMLSKRYDPTRQSANLAGTIAIPRSQTGGLTPAQQAQAAAAVENAATERVTEAGADPGLIPAVGDYFRQTGRFPDLSQLDPEAEGLGGASMAGFSLAGMSPTMLVVLAVVTVGAFYLLRKGPGGRVTR